ncbi:MAG: lipoate--protein ligase family protein [Halanaerobiales bacterium]
MNTEEWRLIDSGISDAYYNMALDEAVMKAHRQNLVPPTIRFYGWSPPGLTLGYFQQIDREVDREACTRYNIDIVRRLTGGRAILHDDELTYSIITTNDEKYLPSGILDSYKIISKGIINGLKNIGLKVELKPVEKGKKAGTGFSPACFDAPSWYEVVADGKKLVGSAQTRQQGIVLQHGSIPFTLDEDLLFSILKTGSDRVKERLKEKFRRKATAVNYQSDKKPDIQTVKNAIRHGWEKVFSVKITEDELLPEEKKWAQELKVNKYATEDWNARR